MKAILMILSCVALFPGIIHGGVSTSKTKNHNKDHPQTSQNAFESGESSRNCSPDGAESASEVMQTEIKINRIMRSGGTIKNIFKPLKYLGRGGYSTTYKGELGRNRKLVAMKISPILNMDDPRLSEEEIFQFRKGHILNEYRMYSYLKAINNATVEGYGIPAVYYYGEWEGCHLLALTLLDSDFRYNPGIDLKDVDVFIALREYVKISKYIHSLGVCSGDSHLGNLMFRRNQGFLFDFNLGKRSNDECKKNDWETFLLNMCFWVDIDVDWQTPKNIVKEIEKLGNSGLKRVLREFAKNVFKGKALDYNGMHDFISKEIKKCGVQEPALVSWLKDEQKTEALAEWRSNPNPDIKTILDPSRISSFEYTEPNFEFFANFD